MTEDIMGLEKIEDKWASFNWHVQRVDGHDMNAVDDAIENAKAASGLSASCKTVDVGFSSASSMSTSVFGGLRPRETRWFLAVFMAIRYSQV